MRFGYTVTAKEKAESSKLKAEIRNHEPGITHARFELLASSFWFFAFVFQLLAFSFGSPFPRLALDAGGSVRHYYAVS
jgi:hypothetical protein